MKVIELFTISNVYVIICLVGTISLSINCLLSYLEDEDVSQTSYKRFQTRDEDNIYPSFSFCIQNPFLEQKLKNYGDGINTKSYVNFLEGKLWDDRMLSIDYDKVTVSLNDSLIAVKMTLHNGIYVYDHLKAYSHENSREMRLSTEQSSYVSYFYPKFYVSFRFATKKCFTFDIPYVEGGFLTFFAIQLRNNIFPGGVRPSEAVPKKDGFITYFHYPGQWLSSGYTNKFKWDVKDNSTTPYIMQFRIVNVNVIKRRNKRKDPCHKNWRLYDEIVMNGLMKYGAGCRPPHWNTTLNLALCSKPTQMRQLKTNPPVLNLQSNPLPCNAVESLQYRYFESDIGTHTRSKYFSLQTKPISMHRFSLLPLVHCWLNNSLYYFLSTFEQIQ